MPDKEKSEDKKPKIKGFGQGFAGGYLVGANSEMPVAKNTKLTLGYSKMVGNETPNGDKSINLSKETKKGGEVSLGYSSNKEASASYTTPKGNSFSAKYSPMGGALVSARINLGKRKKK